MKKQRTKLPNRLGLVLSLPRILVAVAVVGGVASIGLVSKHMSSAATTGNPYGYIDSCALSGTTTLIYGWAADPQDTTNNGTPDVTIKAGTQSVTVPTNLTTYRLAPITAWLKSHHAGDPTPGGYGFVASFSNLYKGPGYPISGTVLNVGIGTNQALPVNSVNSLDGVAANGFPGGVIPQACLSPRPVVSNSTAKSSTPIPSAINTPKPAPAAATPSSSPAAAAQATSPFKTYASSTLTEKHSPYGYADYCSYTNGETVIYGWANDADAPRGNSPSVTVTVSEYAHNPALSGANPVVATSNSTVPTDGSNYRDVAINAWIKSYRYGEASSGIYGFRAAYRGMIQGDYYHLSGSIANVGALGMNTALGINWHGHVDGYANRPYFAGDLVPQECLGPRPTAPIKGRVLVPISITPTAAVAPGAKPVFSQHAPSHGTLTATGSFVCMGGYVKTGANCDPIRYTRIAHGKKAVNIAHKVICDNGYFDYHDACRVNNDIVIAYRGLNDGCGGNATHYAANKRTHVGQVNYGKHSVCQCAANNSFVAFLKPMNDNHDNPKCIIHSSYIPSYNNYSSNSYSGNSGYSSSNYSNSSSNSGYTPPHTSSSKPRSSTPVSTACNGRLIDGECLPRISGTINNSRAPASHCNVTIFGLNCS